MIHPCTVVEVLNMTESIHQESSAIECLPEENVSIVETLEGKEDRPESVRPIVSATTRKKLYFNPAYFELELLMAPPPAALEFLTKIREVITIAKHKMAAKRFLPSLLGIPEENENDATNTNFISAINVSQKKGRQNRYPCEGCPGCVFVQSNSLLKEKSYLPCCDASNENKHQSIQKWLEDITVSKTIHPSDHEETLSNETNLQKEKTCNMPLKLICHKISNSKKKFEEINHFSEQETDSYKMLNAIQPNVEGICSVESVDNACEDEIMIRKSTDCSNETATQIKNLQHNSDYSDNESDTEDVTVQHTINKKCPSSPPPPPPPSTCSSLCTKHNTLRGQDSMNKELLVPKIAKKLMDAVIKEFVDQRAHDCKPDSVEQSDTNKVKADTLQPPEYDSDSLEKILSKKDDEGMRTPSDYGDILQKSNSSIEKPEINDIPEEHVQINGFLNIVEQTVDQKKGSTEILDDHEYEVISLNPENKSNKFILPDILSRGEGYSLVSEVYVNDGYSFSSTSSLPSNHSSSTSNEVKIKYATANPGQLTIEVEDSPSNYEKSYDSDNFEPDTLDRKPNKLKINSDDNFDYNVNRDSFSDSLERPTHISLRTTGSFRSDSLSWYESSRFSNIVDSSPLTRTFGSLREIFEARNRYNDSTNKSETLSPVCSTRSLDTDCYSTLSWKRGKPKFLRPDPRQARRQRQPSPPDRTPPRPPKTIYSNEYILQNMLNYRSISPPLPPRSIKPPLPPKNGSVRSTSQQSVGKKQNCRVLTTLSIPSLMTRGILASASGSSPPSSDYETIDNQQNERDYKKNVSISKKVSSAHNPRGRNNAIIFKSPRDKSCLNYHNKMQLKMSIVPHRTEDSGYLSSDSAGSESKRRDESLSETDDSLCDGASESGAESIATDSFFFGNFHKLSVSNSVDSGMCTGAASVHSDSDSNISFVTVLPTDVCKK